MRGKVKPKMHIYMPNVGKVNLKKNGKAAKGLKKLSFLLEKKAKTKITKKNKK